MNRTPIIIVVALFVAFVSVAPSFAASTTPVKAELKSAYRLLRQDDEYGASKVLWNVRKSLMVSGDSVVLKKVERVLVLIQREDYLAARTRLKSIIR